MPVSEKLRVRAAFTAAAGHYDALAEVQPRIALALHQQLPAAELNADVGTNAILDAGCGTGQLATLLPPSRHAQIIALDHAEGMCLAARQRGLPALAADLEALPLAAHSVGVYWSSLAWQWCCSRQAAREAMRVLRPGGVMLVATLGPGTLAELRAAFASVDTNEHVRRFETPEALQGAIEESGLRLESLASQIHRVHAPSVPALLQGVRGIGAHVLGSERRRGLMGRRAWQRLLAAFEAQRTPDGLPLSYEALLVRAVKPR